MNRALLCGAAATLLVGAQAAHAAPDVFVWPSSLMLCDAPSRIGQTDLGGGVTGAQGSLYTRKLASVVNRGDTDPALTVGRYRITLDTWPTPSYARGGNFAIATSPPRGYHVVEVEPVSPLLPRDSLSVATNCYDALGNSVAVPEGGTCAIAVTHKREILAGRPIYSAKKRRLDLRDDLDGKPGNASIAAVNIFVNEPGCLPGGTVTTWQLAALRIVSDPLEKGFIAVPPEAVAAVLPDGGGGVCNCSETVLQCVLPNTRGSIPVRGWDVVVKSKRAVAESCTSACGRYVSEVCSLVGR
jgi:hypothetical protein